MDASLGWVPHPETWALTIALLLGYMVATTSLAPAGVAPVSGKRKAAFLLGVLLLWLAEDWPLHEIAEEYLFSGHMVQHILFAYVVPPLLLMGLPPWLFRRIVGDGLRWEIFRFMSRPVIAFVLLNGLIAVMHWAPVVEAQSVNTSFHLVFHVAMISAGLFLWSNVVPPVPELDRMTDPLKMMYVFLLSILPTVPASFLTFSGAPLYENYEEAPRLWGISVISDQRVAGLVMKLGAGLLLWAAIGVMFFRWYAREEAGGGAQVGWDDFERELEVFDMRK